MQKVVAAVSILLRSLFYALRSSQGSMNALMLTPFLIVTMAPPTNIAPPLAFETPAPVAWQLLMLTLLMIMAMVVMMRLVLMLMMMW